jgi:hypothetical protein
VISIGVANIKKKREKNKPPFILLKGLKEEM